MPLAQADAGEFTQNKTSRVPTHSIDTVSYKQRASVNILKPPASTSHLTEDRRRPTCRCPRPFVAETTHRVSWMRLAPPLGRQHAFICAGH